MLLLPLSGDVAVKQTAELFVGNVRADRRASGTRAECVRNCGVVAVKQTAKLLVGNVRAGRLRAVRSIFAGQAGPRSGPER